MQLIQAIEGGACAKDTTSILATIEQRYKLDPVGDQATGPRDAEVKGLSKVFDAPEFNNGG